jgi:hypothetical protein
MSDRGFALPTDPAPGAPAPDLEAFTAGVGGLGAVVPGEVIDLDKLRARRREANKQPPAGVRVGGKTYPLPAELPLGVLDAFGRLAMGDMTALADALRLLWPDVVETIPNPELGKPLVDAPYGTVDERETIEAITSSPARELMYEHGLTLPDFEDLLMRAIAGYGVEGGVPSS